MKRKVRSGLRKPKGNCTCCNSRANLHRHHIIPRYCFESTDAWDNIVVLCSSCHLIAHEIIEIIAPANKLDFNRVIELLKIEIMRREAIREKLGVELYMIPLDRDMIESFNRDFKLLG